MTNGNFRIYADGWTVDHAYRMDEAIKKAESLAEITGKEITIYEITTKKAWRVTK